MANVLIDENSMSDIADAIREKLNTADTYLPSEMADAIGSISGGADLGTKSITANGTYNASSDDLDGYSSVTVNVPGDSPTGTKSITANGTGIDVAAYAYADVAVPNSYSSGDEGKVVSNGALVSQTSDTVTSNGTVDTTLINSLTVNVSGGGGGQTATGTINLVEATNVVTFPCSFEPKCVCITADDQTTTFATRHITDYYVHFGFAAILRGMNANSTSKTNYVAALGDYQLGVQFSSYYTISYANGVVTAKCRSGYGFLAGTDTTYTWRAVGY